MNKSLLYGFSGAVILGIWVCTVFLTSNEDVEDSESVQRHISYALLAKNTSAKVIQNAALFILAPEKKTAFQAVENISSDYSFSEDTDAMNNDILHYHFEVFPPYAQKIIKVEATVTFRDKPQTVPHRDTAGYLGKEQFIELDDSRIMALGKRLADRNKQKCLKNIYEYISTTIERSTYSKNEKGALYTLLNKKGDCTEFMHLFIALSRVNGIPARGISGFIIDKDQKLLPENYHDWAEVFINGHWRVIDPFYNAFMTKENNYLVMKIHHPGSTPDKLQRFSALPAQIQISMIQ